MKVQYHQHAKDCKFGSIRPQIEARRYMVPGQQHDAEHQQVRSESQCRDSLDEPRRSSNAPLAQILRLKTSQRLLKTQRNRGSHQRNEGIQQVEDAKIRLVHGANQHDIPENRSQLRCDAVGNRVEQRATCLAAFV